MAKPKKEEKKVTDENFRNEVPIAKLSIDYPNEGINDMARKINEIIDKINGTQSTS